MFRRFLFPFFALFFCFSSGWLTAQVVDIQAYSVGEDGRVQLSIDSDTDHYYVLRVRHSATESFGLPVSITPGQEGMTLISESLAAYPIEHYQVTAYPNDSPADSDGDGIDDLSELDQWPHLNPLNAAFEISPADGVMTLDSFATFQRLSLVDDHVAWSEYLNGKGYLKYIITDFHTDRPLIYFFDTRVHDLHADFAAAVGVEGLGEQVRKGQIIFHPTTISENGTLGTFAFTYSNGHGDEFSTVQRTHELLAANIPFLRNNLSYFVTERSEDEYERDQDFYESSRVAVLFEADVFAEIDYWGLNAAEGYGFFRQIGPDELPGPRDILLYESLPNDLPRVAGIMTSVLQTPLSHVNLRAKQNNVPNAFIRNPLEIDSIAMLLDGPVYFKVAVDKYELRAATLDEVNDWFDDQRPTEPQTPPLNLSYEEILPLDEIEFEMFDGFGAKCTNVATMRTFGFPEGTIPDGFGVPFYFYHEFMRFNNFFEEAATILDDADFRNDRAVREERLQTFRRRIKDAEMPDWMLNQLAEMHAAFPAGTSVRCRSSTNNEDLPGFNGAGLYDSKTQHPDEGHISKSIKQVYASLWNLRAYEEREYFRIDHFVAAMGVLCHPNYSDEKVNGVGVSADPLYNTQHTYYLNSQLGEDLITNPSNNSLPEEILLDRSISGENGYILVQRSSLAPADEKVMSDEYLDLMRDYLTVIHEEFAILYATEDDPNFAMDIEYKVTSDDRLSIKQARPWVAYVTSQGPETGEEIIEGDLTVYPVPASSSITFTSTSPELQQLLITDVNGRVLRQISVSDNEAFRQEINISGLPVGTYFAVAITTEGKILAAKKVIKQ